MQFYILICISNEYFIGFLYSRDNICFRRAKKLHVSNDNSMKCCSMQTDWTIDPRVIQELKRNENVNELYRRTTAATSDGNPFRREENKHDTGNEHLQFVFGSMENVEQIFYSYLIEDVNDTNVDHKDSEKYENHRSQYRHSKIESRNLRSKSKYEADQYNDEHNSRDKRSRSKRKRLRSRSRESKSNRSRSKQRHQNERKSSEKSNRYERISSERLCNGVKPIFIYILTY